jgi:hypothetical protein
MISIEMERDFQFAMSNDGLSVCNNLIGNMLFSGGI